MLWSTQETFSVMESYFPQPLVPPEAFRPMTTLAGLLPDVMTSYYLECRLAPEQAQVDVLVCTTTPAVTSLHQNTLSGMSGFPAEDPVWRRVDQFCAQLAEPDSGLAKRIPHFWLAFDGAELVRALPRPCVLVCLDPDYFTRHADPAHLNTMTDQTYQDTIDKALGALLPDSLTARQRQNLLSCAAHLPPGGQIIHLSVMLARTPNVVRLNITVPREQLIPYLQAVDWTGDFASLASLLTTYCVFPGRVKIQLTIGETIRPRIDLEFHCPGALSDDTRWQALLASVVDAGLGASDKCDALQSWPGSLRGTFPGRRWPTRFQKWVDLKIIAHETASLEAKAYLGFMPNNSIF